MFSDVCLMLLIIENNTRTKCYTRKGISCQCNDATTVLSVCLSMLTERLICFNWSVKLSNEWNECCLKI